MTRKQLASVMATTALALWPAVSMAQLPKPSSSPPSLNPPAQALPQPRPGTSQPPSGNPPSTEAPRSGRGGEQGTKGEKSEDGAFATAASQGGFAEVELGKLAKDHASSPEVKKFADQMIDDHGKANDELRPILEQKGIAASTQLSGKDKSTYDRLSKLNGAAFDRAYIADMVKDHEKDVKEFERESTKGKDPDLKAFATKTLPTLQDHLKMAREAQSKLSGGTN
jgi:putative membrane protein